MNKFLALIAFVVFAGFLLILGIEVPSPDLLVVIGLTLALAGYDFWRSNSDR